jgi:hypothetical protein
VTDDKGSKERRITWCHVNELVWNSQRLLNPALGLAINLLGLPANLLGPLGLKHPLVKLGGICKTKANHDDTERGRRKAKSKVKQTYLRGCRWAPRKWAQRTPHELSVGKKLQRQEKPAEQKASHPCPQLETNLTKSVTH